MSITSLIRLLYHHRENSMNLAALVRQVQRTKFLILCVPNIRQPANKNVPTNPLLGGTVGSRGSFLMAATHKNDLTLSFLA